MLASLRPVRAVAVATAALALLAAGCGDDDDDASTEAADTTEMTTDTTDMTTEMTDGAGTTDDGADDAALAGAATVEVSESSLGTILTSEGRTLYVFVPDDAGPSTCSGQCAENWPPLLVDGAPSAGDGVEAELGTTAREDGSQQATVAGWPLYFFANDTAPGDTNGQGANDVWYAVAPDGSMVEG